MKEFMMIFRNEKVEGGELPSAEQMQAVMNQWQNWIGNIAAKGNFSGTNRLDSEGKTLKPNEVSIDGPYAEVKEMVGGYLVVKANTFDDAVEMAISCPNLLYGGSVEVRSVMAMDADIHSVSFLAVK
ncbi:MAG: transcription initiation protein [Ferruginibacter sp.]|nr:transcription initiation protein [Ferruginibacter sp.]